MLVRSPLETEGRLPGGTPVSGVPSRSGRAAGTPRRILFLPSAVGLVLIGLAVLRLGGAGKQDQEGMAVIERFADGGMGIRFSLPGAYVFVGATDENSQLNRRFERREPQAFLTVRYESGLSGPALLRRSLLEHIEGEIRQFSPVRYGPTYRRMSLRRVSIAGRQAVEHLFGHADEDGNPIRTGAIMIPWDDDSAYYLIFQAPEGVFRQAMEDLRIVMRSIGLSGPLRPR